LKILVKIPLSSFTGYGRDGLGLVQALIRSGHDVYLHATEVQAPIPAEVAALLAKPLTAPFDVTIVHLDPGRLEVDNVEHDTTTRLIAWTMWEWDSFDNLKGKSKLKKHLKQYDAIIGYDKVTSNCFKAYYNGPIFTLQGGYDQKEISYSERDWDAEVFRFAMVGVLSLRKNPYIAIKAFTELCDEDENFNTNARLVLKTVAPPGYFVRMEEVYPNLRIIYDNWDRETLLDFYNHMHVLLAPSWGEGKNLPALEFMSSGGGVIATNWGGMAEWMDEDIAYPLKYELKSMDPYTMKVKAASVDLEDLKAKMKHVFYNREDVKQKGLNASVIIPKKCSWDTVVTRLFDEVIPNVPSRSVLNESERN